MPAIILGVIAIRLTLRDTPESRAPAAVSRHELILNVLWAAVIFGLVYGLLAFGGGLTTVNLFLIVILCALGFIVGYRWVMRRLDKKTAKLYNARDVAFAIIKSPRSFKISNPSDPCGRACSCCHIFSP
ncbi:MAG: hypothetical protein DCC52_11420 [Chloroflexi bacterium]|nr:MAG: hypothetical protein DCC52_11420 [Chloroflexota bacterium]